MEDFCGGGGGGDNNDNKKHFSLIECTKFARIIKNRKDETEMREKMGAKFFRETNKAVRTYTISIRLTFNI